MNATRAWKLGGAAFLLATASALAAIGQGGDERRLRRMETALGRRLASREIHVDPGEVLALRHNRLVRLVILDARSEREYNLFHLIDALHAPVEGPGAARDLARRLPADAVKVVVSNDEARSDEAWKRLVAAGMLNVYVLAGGLNMWLDIYREGRTNAQADPDGDDTLRHEIPLALGARTPWADPPRDDAPERTYEKKVKTLVAATPPKGGCGG